MHAARFFAGRSLFYGVMLLTFIRSSSAAEDVVRIHLDNGRTVAGQVHQATNARQLWLLRQAACVDLVSEIDWQRVTGGEVAGESLTRQELRVWAGKHAVTGRKVLELAETAPPTVEMLPAAPHAKVQTLVIQAHVAQWDGDPQSDGIRVHLAPLDAAGQLVPIDGQVMLTLVAERKLLQGGQSYVGPPTFHELARQSFMVHRADFAGGPAIYDLPFAKIHPDFDPNLASESLVHARLGVPGQGVFEASDAQVQLKECSVFRDQLQYYTPGRYLPLEAGGQDRR